MPVRVGRPGVDMPDYLRDRKPRVPPVVFGQVVVPPPPAPGSSVFPWPGWGTPLLAGAAIDGDSAAIVTNISTQQFMVQHVDHTTPVYFATGSEPRVSFTGTTNFSAGKVMANVPLDPSWEVSPGTDAHLCIIDTDGCEFNFAGCNVSTRFCGYMSNTRHYLNGALEPPGFQVNGQRSGQICLTAGLVMKSELDAGVIPHRLTFACNFRTGGPGHCSNTAHQATTISRAPEPGRLANGAILRLNPATATNATIDGLTTNVYDRIFLRALRDYGALCVDGGGFGFYAQDEISLQGADTYAPTWPLSGSRFLPSSLKSHLQVLDMGPNWFTRYNAKAYNTSETCPGSPVT